MSFLKREVKSFREMYLMIILTLFAFTRQGKVRLYRRVDHRLSHKSKVLTNWYPRISSVRNRDSGKIAYVDLPEYLLLVCGSDQYGNYYTLKGAARRYARKSWKVLKTDKAAALLK